jgi:adenylosuccinate lyase
MPMTGLDALSPLDGRYRTAVGPLRDYLSEKALIRERVVVECDYLRELGKAGVVALTDEEDALLLSWGNDFSDADAARVKEFEKTTNHDVKAVEYFLKEKTKSTTLAGKAEWFHFGLTSEDVNSLAYAFMLRGTLANVIMPALEEIRAALDTLAREHAATAMLARTHGQSASPTTFGKEMRVFESRLKRQMDALAHADIPVKFSGATGTYAAHAAAFPERDWVAFAHAFMARFNAQDAEMHLVLSPATTQIESHDGYAEIFDSIRRINTILLDFSQDMWRYISDGWVKQKPKEGEVGSSTMPHKVNPIDFENAEGNLGVANALCEHFSRKLPISRLQRDLSDSTVERAFGEAFGHALVGYIALHKGLGKIAVDAEAMGETLDAHPEVVAEALQTVLRREGVAVPYEKLKGLTRGKQVTLEEIAAFVDTLSVTDAVKKELKAFTPRSYTGLAGRIASP